MSLKLLIADSEICCRDVLSRSLEDISDFSLVGITHNGKICIEKMQQHKPDLIVISDNLSDYTIIDLTKQILMLSPQCGVLLLLSPDNPQAADLSVASLGAGAFDFIEKPHGKCDEKWISFFQRLLVPKARCFAIKRFSRMARRPLEESGFGSSVAASQDTCVRPEKGLISNGHFRVVLIGVSTGGPEALLHLLPEFSESFPLPIIIVLHMPKNFTGAMAKELDKKSKISVKEVVGDETVVNGTCYLAQGGMHTGVKLNSKGRIELSLIDGPAENGCKPSVDVLFRSAAGILKEKTLAVVMTGMGIDGTKGVAELKKNNAHILVQDEESSVIWGMPGSVVKANLADEIVSLQKMASVITRLVTNHG